MEDAKDRAFASSDTVRAHARGKPITKDSDISKDINKIARSMLSCRLCKKRHDAIILHAIGWGGWKNCASKSEEQCLSSDEGFAQVSGALANLAMCLGISGHLAEATEVERTLRSAIERRGGSWVTPK